MVVYLDSSALVKLVLDEPESSALRLYLLQYPQRVSCGLARVELLQAARRRGHAEARRAQVVIAELRLARLDDALLDAAGRLDQPRLRSLDAIHIAAAQTLGSELEALVTYDRGMAEAAAALGIEVASPA